MGPTLFRNSPAGRVIRAKDGHCAFVPNPLPTIVEWAPELVAVLSDADRTLDKLAGLGRSLLNPHLLIVPFVRREAVPSSRIDGTQASLSDLYAYEAMQLTLFEPPPDVREVYNCLRALEYGLERLRGFPLSLRLFRELHAQLMVGVKSKQWLRHRTTRLTRRWPG